jgi:RND family efflux transporter MFP subunit
MSVKKNIVLIGILVLLLSSCVSKDIPAKRLRPVKYVIISKDMISSGDKVFSGVIQADTSTNLSFKVGGNIQTLNVREGEFIKKGQIIATLDPILYSLKDEEVQAEVAQAYSKYYNDAKYYLRLAKLYKEGAISDRQLDDAKANAESSADGLKSAKKRSEYQTFLMEYTTLKAPIDGYVATINAEINENVEAGTSVIRLISSGDVEVKTNIPEDYINSIKQGDKVSVEIEALNRQKFEGYISDIGADALSNFTTFPVVVKLYNSTSEIKSGMSANVSINLDRSAEKLIVIPMTSVLDDGKSKYVYTLRQTGINQAKVVKTPVEIGEIYASGVKIKKGLTFTDKLVVAGVSKISDGMTVRLDGGIK